MSNTAKQLPLSLGTTYIEVTVFRAGGTRLALTSLPQAELTAAWIGTSVAVNDLQGRHLWLEGDSRCHQFDLQSDQNIPTLNVVKCWLGKSSRSMVSHVLCEANGPADFISKLALNGDVNFYYSDVLPVELYHLLMADCRGVFYPRI